MAAEAVTGEEAIVARELKLKTGWLHEDLERAAKWYREWINSPITRAQNARARAMQSRRLTTDDQQ